MSTKNLLIPCLSISLLLLLLLLLLSCNAQNTSLCATSSCGSTQISYPFRLRSNPPHCGIPDPFFTLDCQNGRAILTSGSQRYNVQAITYTNYSIRLTDPGLSSQNYTTCPTYSFLGDFYKSPNLITAPNVYNMFLSFISCSKPVNDPSYIEAPSCGNASRFSNSSKIYGYVGRYVSSDDLKESCVVDKEAQASSTSPFAESYPYGDHNYTFSTILDFLSYGLELSWYTIYCNCDPNNARCILENNKIRCRHTCFEDTALSERDFLCKLEYYSPYILLIIVPAIGGIILLRCLCGVGFLVAISRSRRRKQAASTTDDVKTVEP